MAPIVVFSPIRHEDRLELVLQMSEICMMTDTVLCPYLLLLQFIPLDYSNRICVMKICDISLIYGQIVKIFASMRKSGLRKMMVTSDLRLKVEIWSFHACTMKNVQYNRYYRNSSVIGRMGQIPSSTEHISSSFYASATVRTVPEAFCFRLCVCALEMGRMSDYDIRPKPKVWAGSPNECRTFGRTSAECCALG